MGAAPRHLSNGDAHLLWRGGSRNRSVGGTRIGRIRRDEPSASRYSDRVPSVCGFLRAGLGSVVVGITIGLLSTTGGGCSNSSLCSAASSIAWGWMDAGPSSSEVARVCGARCGVALSGFQGQVVLRTPNDCHRVADSGDGVCPVACSVTGTDPELLQSAACVGECVAKCECEFYPMTYQAQNGCPCPY